MRQGKMVGVTDTVENTWRQWRERLDVVIDAVRAHAAAQGVDLHVQVEPVEQPSPAAVWNWHLTCTAGEVEFDVIASQDLTGFLVEDDSGRFEIESDAAALPEVVVQRIVR